MSNHRVKVDLYDNSGNKISISLEGRLTREKMLQLLDFVDLMGGPQNTNPGPSETNSSKFEKIYNIVLRKFPAGWFASQEIVIAYEDTFDEPIGLSTVSTYLSRLVEKGMLIKSGSVAKRKYKVINIVNKNIKQKFRVTP